MVQPLKIVVIGLSLSSSWGNGHATTFRSLMRGLRQLGHNMTFLERDVPWYAGHRDLKDADFCELAYYSSVQELAIAYGNCIRRADVVVIGSYVPEGVEVIDAVVPLSTGQLCFYDIDTPVTLTKLSSGEDEYISRRQVGLFDIYFSFTGGPTLDRLRAEFRARRAEPLYCSVDEARYASTGEAPIWDLGYLGTYSPDRQPSLERLLIEVAREMPRHRFVIAGPQYPSTSSWPANVDYIDHLPPSDHASFYSRQRFTLNVTRADMIEAGWSPSVRLFEAAACGCPIISDVWPGLDDFFVPGREIYVAQTTRDVCSILDRANHPAPSDIARRALQRVLANHTGKARARNFLDCLATASYRRQEAPKQHESFRA